jgi:uncharacterized protein YndB with AHSA1/START domain
LVTAPALLSEWLGSTILSDTQYGGFTVTTGAETQQTGLVTTCVPPHYFQATWDDPPHAPSTLLVDVIPAKHHAHLILTHGGIAQELVAECDSFWTAGLDRLSQYVEGRPPTQRPDSRARWQLPRSAGGG